LAPISIDGLAERFPGGDSFRLNGETALDGFPMYSTWSSLFWLEQFPQKNE
jgi:hypothetical protein